MNDHIRIEEIAIKIYREQATEYSNLRHAWKANFIVGQHELYCV
jgi:hypothetical protein